jgi:hypothetical protein
MAKDNTPKPWERQDYETPRAYEAFCKYRDMGTDRAIRAVGRELGKSETLMARWSSNNNWVERVAAWDAEQDRIKREIAQKEQAKAIREMRKRHADLANAILLKAAKALKKIPDDEIRAGDVSRMVDVASKLERLSRGDVGEVIEERDGGQSTPAVTFYMPSNGRDQQNDEEDE